MNVSKESLRHILYYEFKLSHSASDAYRNICQVYGEDALSKATAYSWYNRFDKGDFSVDDKPRSGRPIEIDLDRLQELVEREPRSTTRCLANELGCDHTAILYHLNQLGYRSKLGSWVPHELSQTQQDVRTSICSSLLNSHRTPGWLDHLITGDEKWILYVNITRKHQWLKSNQHPSTTPKPEMHATKVMLSVWWDAKGVVYWQLLPTNENISAKVYCDQLENLMANIKAKRPEHDKIYFLHDNARPHAAKLTVKRLGEFGWTVLPHPPYSPDLAPTDYHLFRALSNSLRDMTFAEMSDLEEWLMEYFDSKPRKFYADGIHELPTRWQQVVDNEGIYLID